MGNGSVKPLDREMESNAPLLHLLGGRGRSSGRHARSEEGRHVSQYVSRLGRRSPAAPSRLRLHRRPRRVAMLSVHTSPLHQPGTGDAGGMNVYIVELAQRLADLGIEVEIFTRATTGALPPAVDLAPGVLVRHVTAGGAEGRAAGGRAGPRARLPPPRLC